MARLDLGLSPTEISSLSLAEYVALLRRSTERERRQDARAALVAWTMARLWGEDPPELESFLRMIALVPETAPPPSALARPVTLIPDEFFER